MMSKYSIIVGYAPYSVASNRVWWDTEHIMMYTLYKAANDSKGPLAFACYPTQQDLD